MPSSNSDIHLNTPKVIAIARDSYLTPTFAFSDAKNLPGVPAPKYGQDITFGYNRRAPENKSVGTTIEQLKPKMLKLLGEFASGDKSGVAEHLIKQFLVDQCRMVTYFDNRSLNKAASNHANIKDWCSLAMSIPNTTPIAQGKKRIHQALSDANWDINNINIPTDLGVPAFNIGSKAFGTKDFNNGLGLMINGVQYVYALAQNYHYDSKANKYTLEVSFIFYDVFGLDDDDLHEYGASSDSMFSSTAAIGITAWWQLQHQHGYAPLVTRIILDRTYEVQTK